MNHYNIQFVFILLLLAGNIMLETESAPLTITTDKEALISFRSQIKLPNPLSTWDANLSPCNWTGVFCNKNGGRVVGLDLSGLGITGSISPHLGNLSFLTSLHLQNNRLTGELPRQLGNLSRLRTLNLSFNGIRGGVPSNVSRCQHLRELDLMQNQISGKFPNEITLLPRLLLLNLAGNQLSGGFPSSLSNISSLVHLNLGTNHLSGQIPRDLGRLAGLKTLDLAINNLSGTVPPEIYNMSSLVYFALASNGFQGDLPRDIAITMPNLSGFHFCFNNFTGTLPWSLHNLTNIKIIRIAHNLLHGTIPPGLGSLPNLEIYNIGFNRIGGSLDFLKLLTNTTRLSFLAVNSNLMEGMIPSSIGNLTRNLTKLYIGGNYIYGTVPSSIGELRELELLDLSSNSISGAIPSEIGLLKELRVLGLADNMLSGKVPDPIGNLQMLTKIDLSKNKLVGSIPKTFGQLRELISMDLSDNNLNGSLPVEIFNLPRLSAFLNLFQNHLTGPLPVEIGLLENIAIINISDNMLSGNIPGSVGNCKSLETLLLSRNMFSGRIPDTLGSVRGLETLDLSSNQLSGAIPLHLQNLQSLKLLNLSHNNLEGKIPNMGVFADPSKVHLESNHNLYSGSSSDRDRDRLTIICIVITSVSAILSLCSVIALIWYNGKGKRTSRDLFEPMNVQPQMISYDELRSATDGFNGENLIGRGSFGFVYRGLLQGAPVAVKVLDATLASSRKSFLAECAALRNVRHRNLVKLRTACSSIDTRNEEFLALVYEFASNGSLDDWISGKRRHGDGTKLSVLERLRCAVGIASAMEYLHSETEVAIVHCDLKPSNVVLDSDMTAKVADFGLAKFLLDADDKSCTCSLRGSIGYIPPEYGFGARATTAGDMYSYGILLLELFTGRTPTDEMFGGGISLKRWVEMQYPANVERVVDNHLVDQMREENHCSKPQTQSIGDCVVAVLGVALSCAAQSPDARPTIRDALRMLQKVEKMLMKRS